MRFSKFWHVQLVCCLEALANTARVMSGQLDMIDQSVYGGNDEKHDTHFSAAGLRERVGQEISAPNISDASGLGAHRIDGQNHGGCVDGEHHTDRQRLDKEILLISRRQQRGLVRT